jgi:thiosulfate/3-mercaptopyruvate sulfurtransferase
MRPQASYKTIWRFLVLAALGSTWASAAALQVPGPLVETGWLADHKGEVVVLDVRKDAASFVGAPPATGKPDLTRLTGHIPGAVSVPWKQVVTKATEQGKTLKSMLPSADAFAALMRASGVSNHSAVVIAGRGTTAKDQAIAARLYFTLKYFGHDNLALLNGGTAQWAKQGRPLVYMQEPVAQGDFGVLETREQLLADTRAVEEAVATGATQLADCRTEDFFLGLSFKRGFVPPEHKGHLAGAKTLPFVLLADNTGPATLFPKEQIEAVARLKGVDLEAPTISYCNTGTTASLGWFALHELLGNRDTRLYDGSMHAWASLDPTHAVVSLSETTGEPTEEVPMAGAEQPATSLAAMPLGALPRSLQTLVDERRDALRRRRNATFDAVSGRHLYQTPMTAAFERTSVAYQDARRAAQRQYRDEVRRRQDAMRDFYAPWSRPHHEAAELRHFLSQMRQLDRQELLHDWRFANAYAPW